MLQSPVELYAPVPGFEVELAVPDFRLQSRASLRLEVIPDQMKRQVYVAANDYWAAPLAWDVFLDRWHRVKVEFDAGSGTAFVWMDNEPVPGTVGLERGPIEAAYGTFTVSSEARAGATVRIEDVEVRIGAPQAGEPRAAAERIRLFLDDFESYGSAEEYLRHGGWVALQRSADKGESIVSSPLNRLLSEYWAPRSGKAERGDFAVDEEDSVSGLRSLRMEKAENGPTVMTKIFSLPFRAPFAVSERPFAVVDREADAGPVRRQDRGSLRRSGDLARASGEAATPLNPGIKVAGPEGAGGGEMGVLSVSPTGTYYIYAFDGRLLAEYNGLGICVRDHIYMGGKLIAEYRPQESSYFYYATDQIGSTRIVTDDTGAVVYAAAHDPWGGIQKTWTNAYDPALKFSGKERDTESGLDYFGARYYDPSLYRFLSVDPLIGKGANLMAPQSWNGYSYCQNDPIGRIEIQGLFSLKITVENVYRVRYGDMTPAGAFPSPKTGLTLLMGGDITPYQGSKGKMELAFELKFDVYILEDSQLALWGKDAQSVWDHEISCHVHFVSQWISLSLGRIEKKWRKEMMNDPEKALQNAYKRLEAVSLRAQWLSKILFDYEFTGILEGLYRYWEGINTDWIPWRNDPYMAWLIGVPNCI